MELSQVYVEDVTVYWILRFVLLGVLLFCGYGITYRNKDNLYFWNYAIFAIVVYSLIEGLRYDRGVDYAQYATELMGNWYIEGERELLYDLLVRCVVALEIPYWAVFIGFSCFIITSFILVVRHFPKYAIWALPLFFLVTDYSAENLIRQFVAIPFIMLAYDAFLCNKKLRMFICLVLPLFIHFSTAMAVGAFVLLVYVKVWKFIKTPWILLAIYLACVVMFDTSMLDSVSDMIQSSDMLDGGGDAKSDYYLEESDRWLTEEGDLNMVSGTGQSRKTLFNTLTEICFNVVMIVFGFFAAREDRRLTIPYYFTFLAIMFRAIGGSIELYDRFAWWYCYLTPLLIAVVLARARKYSFWYEYLIYIAVFLQYLYPWIFIVGQPGPSGAAFVWDIV